VTTLPRIIIERCHYLAECTDEPGMITRPFASKAMRCAQDLAGDWMREAGMSVRHDNVGNLRGRYEGDGDGGATLLLGSHLDSVRNAGKYDGPLGVITAIAAVQRLQDAGTRLPFAVEVLAFADEEGLRYGSTYLGSRAVAGSFDWSDLQRIDAGGIKMADAIRAFGGDPDLIVQDRWQGGDLLGYVEVHIEQGPVLEGRGLPAGVVSAIVGQTRMEVEFLGEAGHAGTVPMDRRKDALAAAAEFVLTVEAAAATQPGTVATVGKLEVEPGAANVIPGHVRLSFDARNADDRVRSEFVEAAMARAREIAKRRKLSFEARATSHNPAVQCSPRLRSMLTQAARDVGQRPVELPSGAGHDAVVMSALTDVGMLFVRCKGGVSHNPAESVTVDDVAVTLDVLSRFLELLAKR
jgi:allantoate deiminase